jgi:acetoin:2,6-dichlorophenolindophenol oxidoreductase subunit beta
MTKMLIAEALRQAIREEMQRDESVFCIGEDIGTEGGWGGAFTVTFGLSEEFGHDRILDTPISEIGIAGVAIGAALMGMRPIADVQYGDFIFCAMDQLVNQAAKLRYMSGGKLKVPMVMRVPVGATGRGAQHAQTVESYFVHVPGLKVACPSTAYDAKGLLKTAIRDDNPVIFFEHKLLYGSKGARKESGSLDVQGEVPDEEYLIPFGVADIKRAGIDVTIVANLRMVYESMEAASRLEKEGISVEVIDPRTLVPLDENTIISSVEKTHRLVIVHEDNLTGGWGAEIAALVSEKAFDYLDSPITRICAPDTPVPFAPVMENFYVPSASRIVEQVRQLCR